MWTYFLLIIAAVAAAEEPRTVKVKFLSFDVPECEIAIRNPAGRAENLTIHAHALSEPRAVLAEDGQLRLFRPLAKPATVDKPATVAEPEPLIAVALPPGEANLIAILSGAGPTLRLSLAADNMTSHKAGTIRFFNLCRQPVGLNLAGARQVIASGKDLVLNPSTKPQEYGQAQFLLADENAQWKTAGGMRWLQLEDVRSILFLLHAPDESGTVLVRGIEEKMPPPRKGP